MRVLDVGCGTGGYLRILVPLVAPGPAVGIDLSATLIAEAQQRTAAGEANVSFRVGNAYDLPFPDASFDRVVATQILLHLADPWRAVTEMRRVLAPGGLISVGEWDWDSTCLAVTDRELGPHLLLGDRRRRAGHFGGVTPKIVTGGVAGLVTAGRGGGHGWPGRARRASASR